MVLTMNRPMARRVPNMVLAAATLLALGACSKPDVGQPCSISWGTSEIRPPDPPTLLAQGGSDYFESGNLSCENLICIVSPAPAGSRYGGGGYCSKPCVSDQDCYQSDTGLVCRQMILDPAFLAELEKTDPALKERYLGDVSFSSYCAVPR
jgi:hypothetical protein